MSVTPYFHIKHKTSANIVVHEEYPGHRMTLSVWKVMRFFRFTVTCPEFVNVDLNVFEHLEEAFRMMINHTANVTNTERGVGGGVKAQENWQSRERVTLSVFPKSNKYIIELSRDELGNVSITSPEMKFTDIPSLNQAMKVCGQVVDVAIGMSQ